MTQISSHYLNQSINSFQNGADRSISPRTIQKLEQSLNKQYSYSLQDRLTMKEFRKELKQYLVNVDMEFRLYNSFGLGTSPTDYQKMTEQEIVGDFKRHLRLTNKNQIR